MARIPLDALRTLPRHEIEDELRATLALIRTRTTSSGKPLGYDEAMGAHYRAGFLAWLLEGAPCGTCGEKGRTDEPPTFTSHARNSHPFVSRMFV